MTVHGLLPFRNYVANVDHNIRLPSPMLRNVVKIQIADLVDRQPLQGFQAAVAGETAGILSQPACYNMVRMLVLRGVWRKDDRGLKDSYFSGDFVGMRGLVLHLAVSPEIK